MQRKSNGNKFAKFISGKGFYVALAICMVGAGSAAWVAVERTIDSIEGQSMPEPPAIHEHSYGFPDSKETQKAVDDSKKKITEESSKSSSVQQTSPPQQQQSQNSESSSKQPTQQEKSQTSQFLMPVAGKIIDKYSEGKLVKNETLDAWRTHSGVDIKADKGADVKSMSDGKVSSVYFDDLYGQCVEIEHKDKIVSLYKGLKDDLKLKVGTEIKAGQVIGKVDEVPCEISKESHIHFEIKKDGHYVNPLSIIK